MAPDRPPVEPMTEDELQGWFEGICRDGDWQSVMTLTLHEANQIIAYSLAKQGQLWVKLEQRTSA